MHKTNSYSYKLSGEPDLTVSRQTEKAAVLLAMKHLQKLSLHRSKSRTYDSIAMIVTLLACQDWPAS